MDKLLCRCNELFTYKDGELFRNKSGGGKSVGSLVGWTDDIHGFKYRRLKIDGKCYLLHRVIFLMFNKTLPELVDHIDGDSMNNRVENLRASCKLSNRWNSAGNNGTQSGHKGVYLDKGRWKALITVNKQKYYLGMYGTKEAAKEVVDAKYKELQKEFAFQHRALIANNNCTSFDYDQEVDETGLVITDNKDSQ